MVDSTGTTSYTYDSLYRVTSVTFPGSRTVAYGYDDAGRRASITYPSGTNQASYAYDNANRLSSVTDWNSRAVAYAYDDAGRMTTATLPASTGIVSTYSYDNADRLTGIAHVQNGSTTIASVGLHPRRRSATDPEGRSSGHAQLRLRRPLLAHQHDVSRAEHDELRLQPSTTIGRGES
jgi:YD repeat-containing protein